MVVGLISALLENLRQKKQLKQLLNKHDPFDKEIIKLVNKKKLTIGIAKIS